MRLRWWKTYAEERDLIREDLKNHGESYGLAILKRTGLGRGTIYVTLQRMEEEGYVTSREEDLPDIRIGATRRLYRLGGIPKRKEAKASLRRLLCW